MKFESKLGGFKQFRELNEMDSVSGIQNTMQNLRKAPIQGRSGMGEAFKGTSAATPGANREVSGTAGAHPLFELNGPAAAGKGQGKGFKPGGFNKNESFVPRAHTPTQGSDPTKSAIGSPTGYNSNEGPMKKMNDNVTNNQSRATKHNFGTKDMSKQPTNQSQKKMGNLQTYGNKPNVFQRAKSFVGMEDGKPKKHVGKGIVTSELFGKTSEVN